MSKRFGYGLTSFAVAATALWFIGCYEQPNYQSDPGFHGNAHVRFINADPASDSLNFSFRTNAYINYNQPTAINLHFPSGTIFTDILASQNHVIDVRNGGDYTGTPLTTLTTDITEGKNKTIVYFGGTTPITVYDYPAMTAPLKKGEISVRFLNAIANADPAGMDLVLNSPYNASPSAKLTGIKYRQLSDTANISVGDGFLQIFITQGGQPKAYFYGLPVAEGTSYTIVAFGTSKTDSVVAFKDFSGQSTAGDLLAEYPRARVRGIHAFVSGTTGYNTDKVSFQFNNNVPYDAPNIAYGTASAYSNIIATLLQSGKVNPQPFVCNAWLPTPPRSVLEPYGMKVGAGTSALKFHGNTFWNILLTGKLDSSAKRGMDSIRVDSLIIGDSILVSNPVNACRVRVVECINMAGLTPSTITFSVNGTSFSAQYQKHKAFELPATGFTITASYNSAQIASATYTAADLSPGKLFYVTLSGVIGGTGGKAPKLSLIP